MKKGHITNKRPTEYRPCEICKVGSWEETHEVFGGPNRNKSIKYGAQMRLCSLCHDDWHRHMTKEEKRLIQARYQKEIMQREDMTLMSWIAEFGKSWL